MTCPAPVSYWIGRPCSASTPLASRSPPGSLASRSRGYAGAVGLMLTRGKVHISGAVRGSISMRTCTVMYGHVQLCTLGSGSRQHLSGAYFWPVPTRRAETSGSGAPCGIASGRARPCISLAPCLCRPSVGDVGIVHVGAGPAALPALLARRPAASILRAPSRPNGSQCATGSGGSGVREFGGGGRPCRGIVRHPGGEIKTACAPPAAADGLDLSALLPSAADKGARAVNFSA